MNKKLLLLLGVSHSVIAMVGFVLGIYLLPILVAPPGPSDQEIETISAQASFSAQFSRDRQDSDALHWGEGELFVNTDSITLMGKLSPGPDYKLYLSPEFVETEQAFEQLKPQMVQIADVKTFNNFMVKVPSDIDVSQYNTVVIWCEAFGEFITSAKYQ